MCQWTTAVLKRELKHPIGGSPAHSFYEDVNMWLRLVLLTKPNIFQPDGLISSWLAARQVWSGRGRWIVAEWTSSPPPSCHHLLCLFKGQRISFSSVIHQRRLKVHFILVESQNDAIQLQVRFVIVCHVYNYLQSNVPFDLQGCSTEPFLHCRAEQRQGRESQMDAKTS